jgi:hypothetical protein
MTKRAGHEHEQDQHSLAAAYSDAAVAHDQAARMHEKIADHYDKHGKPARATRERRKATQELQSATADRKWVATLTAGLSDGLDRSSDKSDRPGPHGADLTALLGATIAILLTLTFGPGAWDLSQRLSACCSWSYCWSSSGAAAQRQTGAKKL